MKARLTAGKDLTVKPHSSGNMIEEYSPFYWDIFGVKVGDEIAIEVLCTDIKDRPQNPFRVTIMAK